MSLVVRQLNVKDITPEEEMDVVQSLLPPNYDFEILKTIRKIRQCKALHVVLQFPEGLLMYAQPIAAILETFCDVEVTIMGDVTYGACCIDDLVAQYLGATLVVHYGHSCLVPVTQVPDVNFLYVFVTIKFDTRHLVETVVSNFPPGGSWGSRMALMGTIQFSPVLAEAKEALEAHYNPGTVLVPQVSPLTPGEVLGCTSPQLAGSPEGRAAGGCCSSSQADMEDMPVTPEGADLVVFTADGRFHLESALIHNPHIRFVRYDPVGKRLLEEKYDHQTLMQRRREAVSETRGAQTVGLVLSTLGRQGSIGVLQGIGRLLEAAGINYYCVLLSEILPFRLEPLAGFTDAFIQVGCPRLSLDWGHHYKKPLLTPYEAHVAFGNYQFPKTHIPMDFYSHEGGPWSNYGVDHRMGNQKKHEMDRRELLRRKLANK
ncbi:MAG: uncharacterized protein KVP18_000213 [Porospora cf. gigantea A]|uniref:uncharacterized protein n=1 Tax=Porospora cf. gigantea A TaxID=2853593 RepID=UPI00355A454A|nr:MAG: hypothetical protein KVP18_000213 [Porospora cf. gigantea A]